MKKVQEMTKQEFEKNWKNAGNDEMVAENITKRHSSEDGGYWYAANSGDCDGGDTLATWYSSEMTDTYTDSGVLHGYVQTLDALI